MAVWGGSRGYCHGVDEQCATESTTLRWMLRAGSQKPTIIMASMRRGEVPGVVRRQTILQRIFLRSPQILTCDFGL